MTQSNASSYDELFIRRAVLVGQNIGANSLLFVALGIYLMVQYGTWHGILIMLLATQAVVGGFVGASLAKRGRLHQAGWVILITNLIAPAFASVVITYLGYVAIAYILVSSYFIINFALQKEVRRVAALVTTASLVIPILSEWANPAWRLTSELMLTLAPIFTAVLGVAFAVLIVRQSWGNILDFMRRSIRNRLTVIVVGAAIIPVLLISIFLGGVTYVRVREALIQTTFDRLDAIEEIKTNQLSGYFAEREDDMRALSDTMGSLLNETLNKMEAINALKHDQILQFFNTWDADVRDVASDPGVVFGVQSLANGFQTLGSAQVRAQYLGKSELELAGDGSGYSAAHFEQHGFFGGYTSIHGYEDAFLIDLDGNVVYSVHKTDAFGTNLLTGAYKDSSLAKLYKNLLTTEAGKSYIADVALFEGTPAMFIGAPIYDGSTLVGMLAYRLPLDTIKTISADKTGQGLTGDTFLVAMEDDGRITYRSDRTSVGNEEFVVGYDITNIASKSMLNALEGKSGSGLIVGSTGEVRINAYRPMEIEGLNWAVFTSVNAIEALSPTHLEGEKDFLTAYKENYDYYDLFLIHPSGYVFYSVSREADYGTNILTGEFKDSTLAGLVGEALESKSYEVVDFAYYAPSGGTPAAFFGIPLVDAEGEIKLILAAQVSVEDINQIVNEAHGLGETGETYIIGQDFLGRMDSRFIEQFGVETTILNPDYAVDTEAVRSALAGESGRGTIIDYRGLPVMSVWKPFTINETKSSGEEEFVWAVMTEIDESEALTPVNRLASGLGLMIGLATLVVGALAIFLGTRFSLGFVTPILNLTDTATRVAAGNLDLRVATDSVDEIGTLTTTFNNMTAQLHDTLEGLEQRVADRTKALATSAEVTRRLAAILDPRQLTSEVVEQIQRSFNYYYAQIYLLDETGANLVIAGGTGEAGASMLARKHSVPKGRGLVGRAADVNASVLVPDVSQEEGWLPNDLLPETKAEAAIPISVGNQVMGVLDVQHSLVNGLTPDDVTLLESLAGQVAISLQNARSYEQSRKQAELESLVNVIGQRIQRTTSIEDTLQTAIREVGLALGAARVSANIQTRRQHDGDAASRN